MANGTTGGDGRFWILTTAKIWDESDNMIKTYAEYGGSERFSPSISNIQIIVVYPVKGEKCENYVYEG